ncbi:response regulator transcription factor [Croceicoccus gelatinilyticus]|uniref:response regulator transcription factor n=1 Tax=Croceicoccus gelatinilyticus TaxID=2835536 RepID=UPI001BCBF2DA|nr:response regulator transcription factor [Croceicoccus gelatinilyticus]MBS7671583.1 response regulator transcription factor [Croceicoccus gelatinilyticus]
MVKVLIADDHPMCVAALQMAVSRVAGNAEVRVTDTLAGVVVELSRGQPDLILLDLGLRDSVGLDTLTKLVALTDTPIISVTGDEQSELPLWAKKVGAKGFIEKRSSFPEMAEAIDVVLKGGEWFPLSTYTGLDVEGGKEFSEGQIADPAPECPIGNLTKAQLAVLHLASKGLSNEEIGRDLSIKLATVKSHMHSIFKNLGVKRRTQAISIYSQFEEL